MKYFIETYGCQMNVADSEIVSSILDKSGYTKTNNIENADIILVNTCSIRENAETRVRGRISVYKKHKKQRNALVGVLGCMAERLKEDLINQEKTVDIVVGPDSYRLLPQMIEEALNGRKIVQTILSDDETYEDILPVRYDNNGVAAFVSIMRGCQNFCSYCIVPYVRGIERSRNPETILNEIKDILEKGFKEVTLIGQNVDSYIYNKTNFAGLLDIVAKEFPLMRIRFSTNHPKDLSDEVLEVMSQYPNICHHIHLPVQSGSNHMLQLMNRGYTREYYLDRIRAIRHFIPDCAISTDIMVGFCDETEEDHQQTLSLMKEVEYDFAFMFKYSERSGTYASKNMKDNIDEKEKIKRLNEVIDLQNKIGRISKQKDVGKTFEVLVEGKSKKSEKEYMGRNSQNKVVVFPSSRPINIGELVQVEIEKYTSATLIGKLIE
ncbi:MAG: tRNA (N6-isopentenyl adenosine(37)-C2)-methylthiotransferase MiaB [Bacteroidales bacterium]|nr:tRNA (N6-isopentenyl adenosine(37)-C2)-methylthiotransferase MiaB [Bacteroidales bacterium]